MAELDNVNTGRRIQELRKRKGWSQQQLAAAAGMSSAYLTHLEDGSFTLYLDYAVKIAVALGTTVDVLRGGAPMPTPS